MVDDVLFYIYYTVVAWLFSLLEIEGINQLPEAKSNTVKESLCYILFLL
jgi:hypothetical protein